MPTLEISKQFKCSKEQLYSAWTDSAQLKQWWKPLGKQLLDVENNITEGGSVKYMFEDKNLLISGNYEKVIDHELLEYSWNWHSDLDSINDATYKLSVRFEGDEQEASIFISQQGFENESVEPHQQGWEQGLEQLKKFVETGNQDEYSNATEGQQLPVTGYMEDPEQVKVGGA